jgi:hypothetical protein
MGHFDHGLVEKSKAPGDLVQPQERATLEIAGENDEIRIVATFADGGRFTGDARGFAELATAKTLIHGRQKQVAALDAFCIAGRIDEALCAGQPAHGPSHRAQREQVKAEPERGPSRGQIGMGTRAAVVQLLESVQKGVVISNERSGPHQAIEILTRERAHCCCLSKRHERIGPLFLAVESPRSWERG